MGCYTCYHTDVALRGRRQGTESLMQVPEAGSASSTMTNGRSSRVTTLRCCASSGGCRKGPYRDQAGYLKRSTPFSHHPTWDHTHRTQGKVKDQVIMNKKEGLCLVPWPMVRVQTVNREQNCRFLIVKMPIFLSLNEFKNACSGLEHSLYSLWISFKWTSEVNPAHYTSL